MATPFKRRLLQVFRFHSVPDNHVLLRIRNEKVVKIYRTGQSPWINPLLDEYILFNIGFRSVVSTIQTRSREGGLVTFEWQTSFTLDPEYGPLGGMLARRCTETDEKVVLQGLIDKLIRDALRQVAAGYGIVDLYSGSVHKRLEQQLNQLLLPPLAEFGIKSFGETPLSLLNVHSPPTTERAVEFVQQCKILTRTSSLPPQQIETWLWKLQITTRLLEKGANVYVGSPLTSLNHLFANLLEGKVDSKELQDNEELARLLSFLPSSAELDSDGVHLPPTKN